MRWTGWILTAIVVGYVGVASGQPTCTECGGRSLAWQALSGEACCSPPGLALSAWRGPNCCCTNQRPCCDNAWDGYCEHHARVQAFLTQVGVPKYRCSPVMLRAQTRGYTVCSECPAATAAVQPPPSPATTTPAPSVRPTSSPPPIPAPSNVAPVPDSSSVRPTPSVAPVLVSPRNEPPKSAVAPDSKLPSELPMPPGEAFRGVGQSWLR
jgi:hypothetical protein